MTQHHPGMRYPIAHYVSCDNFSMRHRHFLVPITLGHEPMIVSEAVQDERWRDAMQKEIQALEDNGT